MVAVDNLMPTAPARPGTRANRPAETGADFPRLLQQAGERPAHEEAAPPQASAAPQTQSGEQPQSEPARPEAEQAQEEQPPRAARAAEKTAEIAGLTAAPPAPIAVGQFIPLTGTVFPAAGRELSPLMQAQFPVQETPQPPAQETPQPPAQETPQPPAQETPQPPAQLPWQEAAPEPIAEDGPELLEALEEPAVPEEPRLEPAALPPAPGAGRGETHSSFELLNFDEMLSPDLKVEPAADDLLDQLQQAMQTALLDEAAEVVIPQVVRGLATLARDGLAEMRLQLQPEDLGHIELRVRTSEGVVRGEMMVQNPEVKHLLDAQLDRLRTALGQQGLELAGFDVGLAGDGRQPDHAGRRQERGSRTGRTAPVEELAQAVGSVRGGHTVDYLI